MRWILPLWAAAAFLSLAACGKKTLPKSQLRAVTGEIVAAAQQAIGRNAEITIRPGVRSFWDRIQGQPAPDFIYVSRADPAQTHSLDRALREIARRHDLTLAETSLPGAIRFDFAFHGVRTHTVHLATPPVPGREEASYPQLAIILDDMGYDRAAANSLLALPFPLTFSVLPHLPDSAEIAEEAYQRGDQVMLHLPMQADSNVRTESVELRVGMDAAEVESDLDGMLATVPHAAGVNNHEGSRATADLALMEELMPDLRRHGLYFIDSRTTTLTVAYDTAERSGVRAAWRKVFLDDTQSKNAILAQLDFAARDAVRDGSAIAIGHPHPETIAALAEGVPRLEKRGIRLVFASDIAR